ncbi:Dyp-type peroxidase [Promicromonospora alba]|uniref:Dyp-type peroxidase n=1 Tax=Promicromonospora alba TaxID=1616110 RepID=A0ABV9HE86_9MICO
MDSLHRLMSIWQQFLNFIEGDTPTAAIDTVTETILTDVIAENASISVGYGENVSTILYPQTNSRFREVEVSARDQAAGDLFVQVCSNDFRSAWEIVRTLTALSIGRAEPRFTHFGSVDSRQAGPAPRNTFGFHDGITDAAGGAITPPDHDLRMEFDRPASGSLGGTFMIFRQLRLAVERWDTESLSRQEQIIGRSKATGVPLKGVHDSHVALMSSAATRILRRPYSYTYGPIPNGGIDAGMLFIAYAGRPNSLVKLAELALSSDPVARYVHDIDGGLYFFPDRPWDQ